MKKTADSNSRDDKIFHCRVCGDVDNHTTFRIREMMFGTREEFEYFKCKSCGCLQIANIPDDMSRYYPDDYYSHQPNAISNHQNLLKSAFEKLLIDTALFDRRYKLNRMAKQFVSLPDYFFRASPNLLKSAGVQNYRARILDVGCGGRAQWLQDLQQIGFNNLLGIDPFIKSDLNVNGIPIRRIDVSSLARQHNGHFDLITLHHSLEHIPDQLSTLLAIKNLLSSSGTCVIRIPTVSSLSWEIYGVNWVELDAPRHLYLHSKESLRKLAKDIGMELFDIQYDTTAFEFYGSEQYKLNIPLTDQNSLWVNPASTVFSQEKQQEFAELAREVNASGSAGRACFFFRHAS